MANNYSVTASSLNIRKGPGTNYAAVGGLSYGAIVTVESSSNGWAKIGSNQYVSMQYLKPVESGSRIAASYKPTSNLYNRPIYLMQTDSRWKNVMYSAINDRSQTIGSSGCGPTSVSMIINQWLDGNYTPITACSYAAAAGYRTSNNGTAWGMFKAIAVKYGLKFLQTSYGATAKQFMDENPGALVVCSMSKGNWTTGGHFILMYNCDVTNVYINDPASTRSTRQKNTFALLKSQCRQYFCFAKPKVEAEKETWQSKVETIEYQNAFVVSASALNIRTAPTTSDGNNIIGMLCEGALAKATKKCGDWYYITGNDANDKAITGWAAATYLVDAKINNVNSDVAVVAKSAIEYLVKIGFINTPDHWYDHVFDVDYLCNLIISIVNTIDSKKITSKKNITISDVSKAINVLVDAKVINSPDYWKNNYKKVKYLDTLICRAAEWLS